MVRRRGWIAGSFTVLVTAGLLVPQGSVAQDVSGPDDGSDYSYSYAPDCYDLSPEEDELAQSVASARESLGLPAAEVDLELSYVARTHAQEMAARGEIYATPEDRLASRVSAWEVLAENVAVSTDLNSLARALAGDAGSDEASGGDLHLGIGLVEKDGRMWGSALVAVGDHDPGNNLGSPCLQITHPEDLPRGAERPNPDPAYIEEVDASDVAYRSPDASGTLAAAARTPFIPVLLVDFSDNPAEAALHSPQAFHEMLFQDGYPHGAGSMRDYFQDQSGGLLDVTGEVSNWLRMPRPYSDYVGSSYGYQTTEPNDWTLVKDAVAAADASTDFCKGDVDKDGLVDALFVVHAGPGAEETSAGLWSLRWSLPTAYPTKDTCANGQVVKVKNFTIEPEEYASTSYSAPGAPERLVSIGIFVHEFGHELGLPDLYDIDYSSPGGVGPWDVMASGAWGFYGNRPWRPTPLSAWSKAELGWAIPTNVGSDSPNTTVVSIDGSQQGASNSVYRLAQGGSETASEYFLIENRERVGWAADFPTGGLAIWHVDEARRSANNGDNATDSARLLELVEADGNDTLGSGSGRGDAGDLFPGSRGVRKIDSSTTPSTDYYGAIDTLLAVESIDDPASSVIVDFFITALRAVPLESPSPTPLESPSPTPLVSSPSPTPDVITLPTGTWYGPTFLDVDRGRRVAGSVASLGETDLSTLVVKARRVRGRYTVKYATAFDLPADVRNSSEMVLELAATAPMAARVEVRNVGDQDWFSLGKLRIGTAIPLTASLPNAAEWVDDSGEVKVRFWKTKKKTFKHHLDSVRVTFQ